MSKRIAFQNFLDTITSFMRNDATSPRVYQLQDKDYTFGDASGPDVVNDNDVALYDSTSGKLLKAQTRSDFLIDASILAEGENVQTDDYTLAATDVLKTIIMNKGTAVNLTVPSNGAVPFEVNTKIGIRRIGAGQLTIVQSGSVTVIPSLGALTDAGQYSLMLLTKTGTNSWYLDNGSTVNAVPPSRTIAGLDLSTNRTSNELNLALASMFQFFHANSTYNRYYGSAIIYGTPSTLAVTVGSLRASPFFVGVNKAFDRIQCEVTTFGASSKVRLGVYSDNGSGYPGALVVDSGELDAGSNGVKPATISVSLTPGVYWLAILGGTATCTYRTFGGASLLSTIFGWDSAMGATTRDPHFSVAKTYGALPDPFTAGATINTTANNMAIILLGKS